MPLVIHQKVSYLSIISNSLSATTQTVILHYLSARLMSVTPSYIRKMSHLSVHFLPFTTSIIFVHMYTFVLLFK